MKIIRSHRELDVYKLAYASALEIYETSKNFPKEELYALTIQIRKSSRSVTANLAEAFRKRKYEKAFISSLSVAEGEAAETQTWLDYTLDHGYISKEKHMKLDAEYDKIIGKLVIMSTHANKWSF